MQQTISKAANHLKEYGYAVIPKFISSQTCAAAVKEIDRLIEGFEPTPQQRIVFKGESSYSQHFLSKYFLESAGNVSFFFQSKAWKNGQLIVPKNQAINKIGHALHQFNPIFEDITYTEGVKQLCEEVGIHNPLVMQSMAILKPPKIGGQVNIHQDSTYLYDEPNKLLGFWIPLEDATLKNGCLWGLPGSHKGLLYGRSKVVNGKSVYETYHEIDYKQEDFVPFEMERGSLAIFFGTFLHKSNQNTSDKSRYAYTWHLKDQSSKWSPENWLQRDAFPPFGKSHK